MLDPEHRLVGPNGDECDEVLPQLCCAVPLKHGIPKLYQSPPWRLPATTPQYRRANQVIERSVAYQMGDVQPGIPPLFRNQDMDIAGFLQYYLGQLGISSTLVMGLITAGMGTVTPTAWVEIDGHMIHNTFLMTDEMSAQEGFYVKQYVSTFYKEDPGTTDKLVICNYLDAPCTTFQMIKFYQTYANDRNIEKYLAAKIYFRQVNPNMMMYHSLMVVWLYTDFHVHPENLEEKWLTRCWGCHEVKPNLKSCTVCKCAKYCSKTCQEEDWKAHKVLHKSLEWVMVTSLDRHETWSRLMWEGFKTHDPRSRS